MTAIDRPLNDEERRLMMELAVGVVSRQTGVSPEVAFDVLDEMTLTLEGDAQDVYLSAGGTVLVHAERDWLAFHAIHSGYDPAGAGQPMQHGSGR